MGGLANLFQRSVGLTPAPLTLLQEAFDQGTIDFWCLAVASFGVPMLPFFMVALRMCQAEIEQIIAASQAARLDMLDVGAKTGLRIETQAPAADQAFADPEAIGIAEGGIGGGNLVLLVDRHGVLAHSPAL